MNFSVLQFPPHELEQILGILNTAIDNHRRWSDTLHTALLCKQSFPQDILHLSAHTQCQFGQWYYGDVGETIRSFPEYTELETVHKVMHDKARSLANTSLQNETINIENYQQFLDSQHQLIVLLDSLHKTLQEHQYSFDALTGAVNRRSITLLVEQSYENVRRHNHTYTIAMLDLDYFKRINDTYGHIVGDQVLKHISQYLTHSLRKSDYVGRYGGEEFLIMLSETNQQQAYEVLHKCMQGLEQQEICLDDITIQVTASVGISQMDRDDEDAWQAVKRADFAMYKAKESGRNTVILAAPPSM